MEKERQIDRDTHRERQRGTHTHTLPTWKPYNQSHALTISPPQQQCTILSLWKLGPTSRVCCVRILFGSQAVHDYGLESSAGFISKNSVRWSKSAVHKVHTFFFPNKHGFKLNMAAFQRIECFVLKGIDLCDI